MRKLSEQNLIPEKLRQGLVNGRSLRWFLLVLGIVLLQIPLNRVSGVIDERHANYLAVLAEIGHSWGGEQHISGPFLLVPYEEKLAVEEKYRENGVEQTLVRWETYERTAILLPEELDITSALFPSYRHRGLYHSLVFEQEIELSGNFRDLGTRLRRMVRESETRKLGDVHVDGAAIVMGLTHPKGIMQISDLTWNEQSARLSPGVLQVGFLSAGFHAGVKVNDNGPGHFRLSARIRGSGSVQFAPVAKRTNVDLRSEWQHPSFIGDVLPNTRVINSKTGFDADWEVSHLVRSYPQSWAAFEAHDPSQFTFGVRLFEPVTLYTEATRAVKYGLMFFVLTFMTMMLIELITGHQPNLIQYALIGGSLVMFFLLLIAYSEHLGFAAAYLIASSMVVLSTSTYCVAVLSRRRLAAIPFVALSGLYAVLYMMLQAEDFALLTGATLLFVALVVAMYFTRKLNNREQG